MLTQFTVAWPGTWILRAHAHSPKARAEPAQDEAGAQAGEDVGVVRTLLLRHVVTLDGDQRPDPGPPLPSPDPHADRVRYDDLHHQHVRQPYAHARLQQLLPG